MVVVTSVKVRGKDMAVLAMLFPSADDTIVSQCQVNVSDQRFYVDVGAFEPEWNRR